MGNLFSRWTKREPMRILTIGLDAAGKTTILYKLKLGQVITTIPTIGFNVETLEYKHVSFTSWDVGGRDKIRPLLRCFYKMMNAIIFVLDSNDRDRVEDAKEELWRTLNEDDLQKAPLLVFCNKQDLPNALRPAEITEKLGLHRIRDRDWYVQGASALEGEGVYEGLDWLSEAFKRKKNDVVLDDGEVRQTNKDSIASGGAQEEVAASKKDPAELLLGYDPASRGNATLERFLPIRRGTECPFAKAAKLWGGPPPPTGTNPPRLPSNHSLEEQAARCAPALAEFVRRSEAGEKLDGFVLELDDDKARTGDVEAFGQCVRRALTALSDRDPAGEAKSVMRASSARIAQRGWHFRFNKASFFLTTFAPCYPASSSRYAFGAGRAFVLLQPEQSFLCHDLPLDTAVTNWEEPKTIRDKVRCAFRAAGRGYLIPPTTRYPVAPHIVKNLKDEEGTPTVYWWEEAETEAGDEGSSSSSESAPESGEEE